MSVSLFPFDVPADDIVIDVTSPDFWSNLGGFFYEAGMNLIELAVIVIAAVLLAWVLKLFVHRVVRRIVSGAKEKANVDDTQAIERSPLAAVRVVQRTRTLGSILQNVINITIFVIAMMLAVSVFAPNALGSLTLLTAAVGAGLGFGAQNIVKDVLNGIFLVAEDQVGIGDVVDTGLATGVVEYVSVRVTHVRDVNGTLWYVRNGEILRIGNMSQGWSRVIIDLSAPADVDLGRVEDIMLETASQLAEEPKWRSRIIERPEIWGLESVSGDALVVRLVMKARSNAKDDVAQELRVRLRQAMEEHGIALPELSSVVLTGPEGAQRVRGANPPRTKSQTLHLYDAKPPERPIWKAKRREQDDKDDKDDKS